MNDNTEMVICGKYQISGSEIKDSRANSIQTTQRRCSKIAPQLMSVEMMVSVMMV